MTTTTAAVPAEATSPVTTTRPDPSVQVPLVTRRDLVKALRDEYARETEQTYTLAQAEILVDQACEAFYHQFTGAGAEHAVASDLRTASYLVWCWKGDDRRRLRDAILTEVDRRLRAQAAAKPALEPVDLAGLTVKGLRERARAAGVRGASRLTKQQLLDALSI